MVISRKLAIAVFLFSAIGFASACERIALMPRPEIDRQGRPIDRERDRGTNDEDRYLSQNDIVGTVERIDHANKEIELHTTEGQVLVLKYDPGTLVYDREHDIGIDALRTRDQVRVRVARNARGEQYADTIRLNDSRTLENQTQ